MGFRFRRSVSIIPGVRINLGKKGASLSLGGRGARVTISPDGTTTHTVGLPGTGLSHSTTSRPGAMREVERAGRRDAPVTHNADKQAAITILAFIALIMCAGIAAAGIQVHPNEPIHFMAAVPAALLLIFIIWVQWSGAFLEKIPVEPPPLPPPPPLSPPELARLEANKRLCEAAVTSVYYYAEGKTEGPVSLFRVAGLVGLNGLPADIQVCREGAQMWEKIPAQLVEDYREIHLDLHFYLRDGQVCGPLPLQNLEFLRAAPEPRMVSGETMVCAKGSEDWRRLVEVMEESKTP